MIGEQAQPSGEAAETARRLDAELTWYSAHSARARWAYYGLKFVQIAAGAALPILAVGAETTVLRYAAAILGALVAAAESAIQLLQCDRNWQRWRATAEVLNREKTLFLQGVRPYDHDDSEANRRLCAERVEDIVAGEVAGWIELQNMRNAERRLGNTGSGPAAGVDAPSS